MTFFDCTKELNKNSDLYNFLSSTLENLYKQLNLQKSKKNNLVTLTDKLSNINVENSSNINTTLLLKTIEELKICLENIRTNIDDINKLINQLKNILSSIDNNQNTNQNINLALYYTLYVEKQNVILEKDIKTETLFGKIYKFNNIIEAPNILNNNIIEENNQEENISTHKTDTSIQILDDLTMNSKEEINNAKEDIKQETSTIHLDNSSKQTTTNALNNATLNQIDTDTSNNESLQIIENNEILSDNNTLTISETQNKVFLPYKISDLELKLKENPKKYDSLTDLINKEYIMPLSKYKNSSLARFKEAYSLMKNREKASFTKCLDLAIELAFKYNLNPAVITACKNLDELDIYLDCLDDMALDDFKIFNIKYEIPPAIQA